MDKEKDEKKKEEVTEEIDDLEAFFNEAAEGKEDAETSEEDVEDNTKEETEVEEDKEEEQKSSDDEEGQEEGQDIEDAEEIPTDPKLLLERYKTLQAMYKQQIEKEKQTKTEEPKTEEPKTEETKETTESKTEEPEEPQVDVSWVKETLSSTEKYKEFSEDFPEIAGVLEAAISSVFEKYTKSLAVAFQTLMKQIDEKYQPIASSVKEISEKEKQAEIKQYHPDYDTIINSQEFKDWLNAQPPLLKKAYTQVLEEGTVQDLAELLNDFKLKTGFTQQQDTKPAKKKKPKTAPETKSKPTTVREPVDMDDFEQAFYEAVREGG